VLEHHSLFAYTTAYLFTAGILLDFANGHWFHRRLLYAFCPLFFIASASLLIYVGYLGGTLVFEQGAAVEKCCKQKV